jgi:small multidrug resistance pump
VLHRAAQLGERTAVAWICLLLAIGLEVSGTTCMKLSNGFTRVTPSVLIFAFYGCSIVALTLAMRRLDISVSYAVWSGVGTGLMAVIGIVWFGEPLTHLKVLALTLIIVGVVTVHLSH